MREQLLTKLKASNASDFEKTQHSDLLKKAKREQYRKNQEAIELKLFHAIEKQWPNKVTPQHLSIPNRKFRTDFAFVEEKLAIEFDGWESHGKYKEGFQKDRIKQNLYVVNGWRVLRFFYAQVTDDLELIKVISTIEQALLASASSKH